MVVARAEIVRTLMEERGMSVYALAGALGMSDETVRSVLAKNPVSGQTISRMMAVFERGMDDLFEAAEEIEAEEVPA